MRYWQAFKARVSRTLRRLVPMHLRLDHLAALEAQLRRCQLQRVRVAEKMIWQVPYQVL